MNVPFQSSLLSNSYTQSQFNYNNISRYNHSQYNQFNINNQYNYNYNRHISHLHHNDQFQHHNNVNIGYNNGTYVQYMQSKPLNVPNIQTPTTPAIQPKVKPIIAANNNGFDNKPNKIPTHKLLSSLEELLSNIVGGLKKWFVKKKTTGYQRRILKVARKLLELLSGHNIIGLLSNLLSEYEAISIEPINQIFEDIYKYLDNKKNTQWKILQIIVPHISFPTLHQYGIPIIYNTYLDTIKKKKKK